MPAFRFIHASDLHLGSRFGNIPQPPDGNIRGRLMEARHAAIGRIARAARDAGATDILLAGDTFDSATPSDSVVRQAIAAMADAGDLTWWLLPGNHDSLQGAEPLWSAIVTDAPANLRVIRTAESLAPAPGVALLPCPVTHRAPGRDLTGDLPAMASDAGALRIGLAHGGIADFDGDGTSIPPDRDRTARLDYLALGDWHGRLQVGPRVHYSGSPEQDRFKHDRRGVCLSVSIDGPGAKPDVTEVETGTFLWSEIRLNMEPGQDVAAMLDATLAKAGRRDHLLRLRVAGWAGLADRAALQVAVARIAPEFAHLDLVTDDLGTLHDAADLDEIDRQGALRIAADRLAAEAADRNLPADARAVAGGALARLHAYVTGAAE